MNKFKSPEERDIALAQLQNYVVEAHCAAHEVSMDGSHYFRLRDAIDAIYKLMQKYGPIAEWGF